MSKKLETCIACLGSEPGFCGLCGTAGEVTPDMNEWYSSYKKSGSTHSTSEPRTEPVKFVPSWEKNDV